MWSCCTGMAAAKWKVKVGAGCTAPLWQRSELWQGRLRSRTVPRQSGPWYASEASTQSLAEAVAKGHEQSWERGLSEAGGKGGLAPWQRG